MTEIVAPTTMYSMEPLISLPEKLPQTAIMYKMNNIHEQTRSFIEEQRQVRELESRQEKILGQLAELKQMIASLSDMVKNIDQTETTTINKEEANKDPITIDLVIKVNESQIPYSLLAFKTIWRDTYFNISCHTHSDKGTDVLNENIVSFEKVIQSNKQEVQNKKGLNIVNVTLIWKNTDILEVNTGITNLCILGEINLLRFLSRAIINHNYEHQLSSREPSSIDTILDKCYEAVITKSEKVFNDVLIIFDNVLKTGNTWLASKDKPTIADISAWSVIKNSPTKKLPNNVAKWFERCQAQFCC